MSTLFPSIEVSLDNLLHNLALIRGKAPAGVGVLAVVKDNAYGCGSRFLAQALERSGVGFFAVARAPEAFFLRKNGISSPILVLGNATRAELRRGHASNLLFTLNDLSDIERWESCGVPVRCHCNIDTMMHRMGILPSEAAAAADALCRSGRIALEGLFTHLSNADEEGTATVSRQLDLFAEAVSVFERRGIVPRHRHYANSAGIMRFDLPDCTLVRPGIALYGCVPDPAQQWKTDLRPVVTLRSRVVKVKRVPSGTPVSYGGEYVTNRETVIATVALGYAHGYPRSLSNKGDLLLGGRRCRIAGRVTMDYCMVDAGVDARVKPGDEIIAIGRQGSEAITPDEIARLDGTIGYEVLCRLAAALPRSYIFKRRIIGREKGRLF